MRLATVRTLEPEQPNARASRLTVEAVLEGAYPGPAFGQWIEQQLTDLRTAARGRGYMVLDQPPSVFVAEGIEHQWQPDEHAEVGAALARPHKSYLVRVGIWVTT